MNWSQILNSFDKAAFLVKNNKIVDFNKFFAKLGKFEADKSIYELFYFVEVIENQDIHTIETECIYNYNFFKFKSTKLNDSEFDFLVFLEPIKKTTIFKPNLNITNLIHLGYIIIYFYPDGLIKEISISPNIKERFGIEEKSATLENFQKLFTIEDFQMIKEKIESVVFKENKQIEFTVNLIIQGKGSYNIYARGFFENKDGVPKVILTTNNFNDLKAIFAEFIGTENAFKSLFYNNYDPAFIINRELTIIDFNEAAKLKAEKFNINLQQGLIIDQIFKLKENIDSVDFFNNVTRFENTTTVNGINEIIVEITTIPISYEDQNAIIIIARDLTEYKFMINQIIENEKKFKEIINSAYDGIIVLNKNGFIEHWNKAAENILEYKFEEVVNKHISFLFNMNKSKENFHTFFEKNNIVESIKNHASTLRFRSKSGKENIIDIKFSQFFFNESLKIIAIVRNITESVKIQEQLQKSKKTLEETNDALKRFISILSHDIRTPLTQVQSLVEIFDKDFIVNSPDEAIELLKMLKSSASNGLNLLDQLLQWGRAMSNKVLYNPTIFNIQDAINQSLKIFANIAENKNITLNFKYDQDKILVIADFNMILTVINNILSNAIKFSYPNTQINVYAENYEIFCLVGIEDFGIGIEQTKLDNIFSCSKTNKTDGTNHEKGWGLGLFFVKELVRNNCGNIWIDSQPSKGTTVFFTLPKYLKIVKSEPHYRYFAT